MKKKVLVYVIVAALFLGVSLAVFKLAAKKEDAKPAAPKSTSLEIASNAACAAMSVAKLNELTGFKVDTTAVKPSSNEGANCDFRVGKGVLTAGKTDTATLMLGKKKYMPLRSDYKTAVDMPNVNDPEAFIVPNIDGTAMAYQRKGDWFVGVKLFSKNTYTNLQIKNLLKYVIDQI